MNTLDIKIGSEEYVTNSSGLVGRKTSAVYISINDKIAGFYKISNQYRKGFEKVLNTLKLNFNLFLVSGDNDSETEYLIEYFEKGNLLFNQKPGNKADFIQSLQEKGHTVLMTGDG